MGLHHHARKGRLREAMDLEERRVVGERRDDLHVVEELQLVERREGVVVERTRQHHVFEEAATTGLEPATSGWLAERRKRVYARRGAGTTTQRPSPDRERRCTHPRWKFCRTFLSTAGSPKGTTCRKQTTSFKKERWRTCRHQPPAPAVRQQAVQTAGNQGSRWLQQQAAGQPP